MGGQPNKFKHYLRYLDAGSWYYLTLVGTTVTPTLTKTELTRAPEGWKDYLVGWQRGWQYKGIFRTFSTPIKFYKDAARILRHYFYTYGIEANLELMIEMRNDADWTFDMLFRGDLDFLKFDDQYDHVLIPINEGGFASKLKARESTTYEYPLATDPEVKYVKVPSINLQSTLHFIATNNPMAQAFGAGIYPFLVYYDTEGTNLELSVFDVSPPTTAHFIRNHSSETFDVDIKVELRAKIITNPANTVNGYFYLHRTVWDTNSSGTITGLASSTDIYYGGAPQAPNTTVWYTISQTDTITLAPNQIVEYSFEMYTGLGGGASALQGFECNELIGKVKVYHVGATSAQYVPCLTVKRVFDLLCASIGEDPDLTSDSTLLTTTFNNEDYLTSGDGLRNLEGAVLKTSFAALYEYVNSFASAAVKYNKSINSVSIESIAEVFDETEVYHLGEVKSCENIPFTKEMFVNLKIGGPYKTLDDVNGKDAVNMTSEFMSPVVRALGDKSLVSGYITEMYDIVLTMQNLTDKETVDADSDNEVYALHANSSVDGTFTIEPAGTVTDYYDVYKKAINLTAGASYWEIQNVFSPESLFNIKYTPKRRLLNNGRYFRSLFWFNDSGYIKFQTSSKNKMNDDKMITIEGATPVTIDEGSDELISSLCSNDDLLFYPIVHRVVAKEVNNIYAEIEANPYGYVSYTWLGEERSMFIDENSVKINDRGELTFLGISTTLQLPNTLIR